MANHDATQPLCKICNSPHREMLDQLLSDPKQSQEAVRRYMEEKHGEKFTPRCIRVHKQRHLKSTQNQTIQAAEANGEQVQINKRYDDKQVDPIDKAQTAHYMVEKAIKFIRSVESVHPSQVPHGTIQKYMQEVREYIKVLQGLEKGSAGENNINIAMVNYEVVGVLRAVAETVREIFPDKQDVFTLALQARLKDLDSYIVNPSEPMALMTPSEVSNRMRDVTKG